MDIATSPEVADFVQTQIVTAFVLLESFEGPVYPSSFTQAELVGVASHSYP